MLWILGTVLLLGTGGWTSPSSVPNPLLGDWKGDDGRMVRFAPDRVIDRGAEGAITVFNVQYGDSTATLRAWCSEIVHTFSVEGDTLTLTSTFGTQTLQRVEPPSPLLDLHPLKLGDPTTLPQERVRTIQQELDRRAALDQAVRNDSSRLDERDRVDADNTAYVKRLVRDVGWIDVERFGERGAEAAFLLVQHSADLSLMMATLPEIEPAVKAGDLNPEHYALLYDRLMLDLGKKQRYGSQLCMNTPGVALIAPLEDRARVEQFREAIGLYPLSSYLKLIESLDQVDEVRFFEHDD